MNIKLIVEASFSEGDDDGRHRFAEVMLTPEFLRTLEEKRLLVANNGLIDASVACDIHWDAPDANPEARSWMIIDQQTVVFACQPIEETDSPGLLSAEVEIDRLLMALRIPQEVIRVSWGGLRNMTPPGKVGSFEVSEAASSRIH